MTGLDPAAPRPSGAAPLGATSAPVAFPFSAIVGQDDLREALLACAVDPAIGGVLVRGERGTAKTTAVRGLAPLVGSLVELPIGATADRVLGTLDLDRALAEGASAFRPGLLANAHSGLLYVDEVNLLPDHLVDVLLDAAALGRVHIERDGISTSYDAKFLLVGTMNPEEGDLRPQLLDRFGLSVEVVGSPDPAVRMEIVQRRLAFDADPERFAAGFAGEEAALERRVAAARERIVALPDRMLLLIVSTCARLGVDGHRADIVTARTAKALAALDGADEVTREHVRRAARLALAHRRRRGPLQQPGLDPEELDEAMGDDDPEPPGGGGGNPRTPEQSESAGDDAPAGEPATTRGEAESPAGAEPAPARADATPPGIAERPYRAEAPAPHRTDAPGEPGHAPLLELAGVGKGASGRRSRATGGPPIDSRTPDGPITDLALAPSLRAAALRRALAGGASAPARSALAGAASAPAQRAAAPPALTPPDRAAAPPALTAADLREHVRAGREGNLVVFCVDASGSMGARRRMTRVKGAILGLLTDAYQRRDRVALVTFRGDAAELTMPPTSSVERAAALLATLPTGGRTPLAQGLDEAARVVALETRRDPTRRALALIVTDGRSQDRAAALQAVQRLAAVATVVVFDGEQGPVRLGLAGELAEAAQARLLPLTALEAAA